MSFFVVRNKDAFSVPLGAASTGPLVGPLEAFRTSVEAQMRASSVYGLEYYLHELDWQQTKALIDAGVADAPQMMLALEGRTPEDDKTVYESLSPLVKPTLPGVRELLDPTQMFDRTTGYYDEFSPDRSQEYLDVARLYAGGFSDAEFEARLKGYDDRIRKLKQQYPELGLRTSQEMLAQVQRDAAEIERREATDRRTLVGEAGSFIGAMVASINPQTDPFNAATLGVGGAGRTAAQRIAAQAGGQGAIEAVNQITGVQQNRELLGLPHGFMDAATRVGFTAAGAGVFQGAGEVLVAGARRFFRDTPSDPAPPPSIVDPPRPARQELPAPPERAEEAQAIRLREDTRTYYDIAEEIGTLAGLTRTAGRSALDMRIAERQLSKWDGAAPHALRAGFEPQRLDIQGLSEMVERVNVRALAMREDPVTMRRYDRLVARKQRLLDETEAAGLRYDSDLDVTLQRAINVEKELKQTLRDVQGKSNKKKVKSELREVQQDIKELQTLRRAGDTAEMSELRQEAMRTDAEMRDLAPLVSRAYARARGKWQESAAQTDNVIDAFSRGRVVDERDIASNDIPSFDETVALSDRAPVLRQTTIRAGETAAQAAARVVETNQKVIDDALNAYRAQIDTLVSGAEDGKLRIDGTDYEFDLDADKLIVPNEEGTGGREVTVREYLEETRRAEAELEAVSVCSIR